MDASNAIVALTLVSVIFGVAYPLGLNERVKRKLTCPRTNSAADVDIVQRYQRSDKPVRVKSCSLLADPKKVDCGQECLKRPA